MECGMIRSSWVGSVVRVRVRIRGRAWVRVRVKIS